MKFTQRLLNLSFTLGQGDFGESGSDTVTFTGVRCRIEISRAGGLNYSEISLRAFGLPLDVMNRLTLLNAIAYQEQIFNRVTVSAGDADSMSVCFIGQIREAWAEGAQPPDISFVMTGYNGMYDMTRPIPPTSFRGSVDVAMALNGIATQMGYALIDNGVTGTITNPYWPGTARAQIEALSRAAGLSIDIDEGARTITAWPRGAAREDTAIKISKETGMIGYPTFTQLGVVLACDYNPSLQFGRIVEVESEFSVANGKWIIIGVTHTLDSLAPGGNWMTTIECSPAQQAPGISSR